MGEAGGAKQVECGGGDPGNAPCLGAEAAGQLACAPRPLSTLCPQSPGFCRDSEPRNPRPQTGAGQVAWLYQRASSGSPAGLQKGALRSQCAFCFGYREAVLWPAPPSRLGKERRSRRAPQEQRLTAAGSGMRRVITFARPGWLPGSQIPSPSRTLELRLDSFSPVPVGLETPSL